MKKISNRFMKVTALCLIIIMSVLLPSGCSSKSDVKIGEIINELQSNTPEPNTDIESGTNYSGNLESITRDIYNNIADPNTTDEAYIYINNNVPFFTDEEMTTESFELYSELDSFGRCGTAFACLGTDTMPTEERGKIGMIKPSGWHTIRYDFVDGKYLYNRCHLIGYQLSGENANERNLITGTRYLNVVGMLPFENETADYIKSTGNHVMYRVTPIFSDFDALSRGVLMEAKSVEDDGLEFCVFCYNRQPGVVIDFETGLSSEK